MKKSIRIYTNLVGENWSAKSLETGVGGSEEILILLARELASRGHKITIYHNGEHGIFDDVEYRGHKEFKPYEFSDIFISFKNRPVLDFTINSDKIIHWTTEIEPSWKRFEVEAIDQIVHMSKYHEARNTVGQSALKSKSIIIGNPTNFDEMKKLQGTKKTKIALYSSSFDRGLENVLTYWNEIKSVLGINTLKITYGWNFIDKMAAGNPNMLVWKKKMDELMQQPGIELLGRVSRQELNKLYAKAKFWMLPLNNADSELFCINAIKAQYLQAQPVVIRDGALKETVLNYVDFNKMLLKQTEKLELTKGEIDQNTKHAEQFSLNDIADQWEKILI